MSSRELEEDILRALRRITRAIDLHSRKLANTFGLTGPQLVTLRVLRQLGQATPSALAKEVALSQSTVTGIVDRLATRQLVTRRRNTEDRRQVTVTLTDAGRAVIDEAPSPLQETFSKQLTELPPKEQMAIRDALERVVRMMGGEKVEAAPVLTTASGSQLVEEVSDAGGDIEVQEVEDTSRAPDKEASPGEHSKDK